MLTLGKEADGMILSMSCDPFSGITCFITGSGWAVKTNYLKPVDEVILYLNKNSTTDDASFGYPNPVQKGGQSH